MKEKGNKMFPLTGSFCRTRRVAIWGTAALLITIGCPPAGRSQQAASGVPAVPAAGPLLLSPQQVMASIKSPTDITPVRDGIRSGTLFRAMTPFSEETLRRRDGTQTEASFTVPLMIDRVQNRLSVQALVNSRKVRLILDTGAMPVISLDQTTAQGINLTDKVSIQQVGSQGYEPATLGLAEKLTLGNLTLQQIPTSVSRKKSFYDCALGLSAFEHYRITLDFAAKTMTLTRGGVPVPLSRGGASLSVPFDDDNGYLFVPVRVLGQEGWAMLDSGADVTLLSFGAATAAAAHLPSSDTKTIVSDQEIGVGDTARKFKIIGLKEPVPISMNTVHDDTHFSTTSQFGTSQIDDVLDSSLSTHTHIVAQLGFPFLLQFQRVIVDYPSHTLILQYPARNAFIKVTLSPTDHDKPWLGYKWQQVGYAWIEVPDGKGTLSPPLPVASPQENTTRIVSTATVAMKDGTATTVITTITTKDGMTTATNTQGLKVIVSPPDKGSIAVTVNGTRSVYPFPSGSIVKVTNEGTVIIVTTSDPAK